MIYIIQPFEQVVMHQETDLRGNTYWVVDQLETSLKYKEEIVAQAEGESDQGFFRRASRKLANSYWYIISAEINSYDDVWPVATHMVGNGHGKTFAKATSELLRHRQRLAQ